MGDGVGAGVAVGIGVGVGDGLGVGVGVGAGDDVGVGAGAMETGGAMAVPLSPPQPAMHNDRTATVANSFPVMIPPSQGI